jgi:hypothetical protein
VDRGYPKTAAEGTKSTLEAWLDYLRDGVLIKVHGLSDADASRTLVQSETTVTGIVRHLANVERWWLSCVMADEHTSAVFEHEWSVDATTSLSDAADAYEAACDEGRRVQFATATLEDAALHQGFEELNYGWVLGHLVEETARHLGHLDLLRELIDGSVST